MGGGRSVGVVEVAVDEGEGGKGRERSIQAGAEAVPRSTVGGRLFLAARI